MAKRKVRLVSNDAGKPTTKTAAAKKWIAENPATASYAEIISGVKSEYGFDLKSADIANAKTFFRKSGKTRGDGAVKTPKIRRSTLIKAKLPRKSAATNPETGGKMSSGDAVSATLDLVAAVGLDQARAILAGLGR